MGYITFGLLVINAINVVAPVNVAPIVNNSWDMNAWNEHVSWLTGTGEPNSTAFGVVLVSHTYGPLADITNLIRGDKIAIYRDGMYYQYEVTGTNTLYTLDELTDLIVSDEPILVLMICHPDNEAIRFTVTARYVTSQYVSEIHG